MNKGIYISALDAHSGKSLVSLGLMQNLLGKTAKVAYFRPIIDEVEEGEKDNHIDAVLTYFQLSQPYVSTFVYTQTEVMQLRNQGKMDFVIDAIIEKYKSLEAQYDFVLVEGTDFKGDGQAFEFDVNILVAKNLGLPCILVSNAFQKELEEYQAGVHLAYQSYVEEEVRVLAMVANKIDASQLEIFEQALQAIFQSDALVYGIPNIDTLQHADLLEIQKTLNAEVLFGEEYLSNRSGAFAVGAMQLRNFLTHLKENSLVVTPGDRADIILAALQAHISQNYPSISGMVLTGGLKPENSVLQLIKGLETVVPILSVQQGTFEAANLIGNIKSRINALNEEKIDESISIFQQYIDGNSILEKTVEFQTSVVTPQMFQYSLIQKAKKNRKKIVLPEGLDARILQAAARLSSLNLVDLVLLGNPQKIKEKALSLGLTFDYSSIEMIDPIKSPHFEEYVDTLYMLRKHKGINRDIARDWMTDVSYFGTMMIYKGEADGMVSGAVHTTQHTIKPALQFIKTKPGVSIVSSVFFMCLEDRVSVFGDCAINPNPNAEQLAEIAISSAESSEAFGIEPRVAMLSYSSGNSGKGEEVDKVREATKIIKKERPNLKVEGPIQYDAAVDAEVGKTKLPDSEVAGRASVLIFPDLNTGNNTYKAVQRETGALAIGPMLQGLNKPVNDLSRGCTVEDIFNTVIITSIQAAGI